MRVFRYCSPFDVLFGYENEINYRYRSICALSCYIRYAIILRSSGVQDSSNRIKLVLVSFTASHLEYRWTSIYWYFARSSLLGNTSNYNTIFICWLGRFITTCLYPKRHISLIKDRFSGLNEITDIWGYLEINHSWLCDIQKDFSCSKMFFQIFDKGYVQSFVLFYSISIIYSLICAHLSSLPRGNSSILLFWWYPIVSNIGKLLFHLSHIHLK
jgi:hypothetical protein